MTYVVVLLAGKLKDQSYLMDLEFAEAIQIVKLFNLVKSFDSFSSAFICKMT